MLAEQMAKMSLFGPILGREKRYASNYKPEVYEAWQLWLGRDIVRCIYPYSSSICSFAFKLHEFRRTILEDPNHLQDYQFEKSGIPFDAYD